MNPYTFTLRDFLPSSNHDERKIGRIEFIWYFLILLFFSSVIWYIMTPYFQISREDFDLFQQWLPVSDPQNLLFGNLTWIILYGVSYYFLYGIISKRFLDIGWTNKSPKILMSIFLIGNFWSFGLWAYSGYFGNPLLKLLESNFFFQIVSSGVGWLIIWSFIGIILICISSMVFPGKKEVIVEGDDENRK